jgi:hypothetical protein
MVFLEVKRTAIRESSTIWNFLPDGYYHHHICLSTQVLLINIIYLWNYYTF